MSRLAIPGSLPSRAAWNRIALARGGRSGPGLCPCDRCNEPAEPACAVCEADGVPLDDELRCEMCREEEK